MAMEYNVEVDLSGIRTTAEELTALAELSLLLERMDESARIRCLNYLRAKYVPNGNLPESTGVTWTQPWTVGTLGSVFC